jgi:hypothetical protein
MTIKYEINGKTITNSLKTYGKTVYYIGSEITVYVDKNNPVNIYTPYITDETLSINLCILGVLIILFAIGLRFLMIN